MNLRIKQSLPLIPGALPLKSGGAPEIRGTRFPHIDTAPGWLQIIYSTLYIIPPPPTSACYITHARENCILQNDSDPDLLSQASEQANEDIEESALDIVYCP